MIFFDVKKRITCAYDILSFIPYWVIVIPSFNIISKKGSHGTANLVLSNAKKLIYNFVNGHDI